MDASFKYKVEKTEHVQGLRAEARLRSIPDARFYVFVVLGLIFTLLFIEWRIPGALLWMFLGISVYCVAHMIIFARQRATAADPAVDGYEVEFRADEVIQRSKIAERHWPIEALRRVEELPDIVFLQFAGSDWLVLPNRLWRTAGERSDYVTHLREMGPNVATPLKWVSIGIPALLIVGGIAAGLDGALLSHGLLYLAGIDLCDCTVRQSGTGRALTAGVALGALLLVPCAMLGLERLRRLRPRLSKSIAAALILPQALIGIWAGLRFLRFF